MVKGLSLPGMWTTRFRPFAPCFPPYSALQQERSAGLTPRGYDKMSFHHFQTLPVFSYPLPLPIPLNFQFISFSSLQSIYSHLIKCIPPFYFLYLQLTPLSPKLSFSFPRLLLRAVYLSLSRSLYFIFSIPSPTTPCTLFPSPSPLSLFAFAEVHS